MSLRYRGHAVDAAAPAPSLRQAGAPPPASRILVLVHGLCMSDLQWRRDGHDHGIALAQELGCSAIYLRYNTGLHIDENGGSFDRLLESLVRNWPVPVEEVCIVGHSMGGLVARSACGHAQARGSTWLAHLRKLVFLGTPHFGAPLERGGRWIDFALEVSPYSAPLARIGKARSAGIRDLRHGVVTHDGRHPPLPRGVRCYAAAAVVAKKRSLLADRLVGDGLVPLHSALGRHRDRSRALGIPKAHRWIAYETGHLDLLRRPEVYRQLRRWLGDGTLADPSQDRS
jgi:pimeloyl-ACP methyl ester carboxylesterase